MLINLNIYSLAYSEGICEQIVIYIENIFLLQPTVKHSLVSITKPTLILCVVLSLDINKGYDFTSEPYITYHKKMKVFHIFSEIFNNLVKRDIRSR